MLPSQCQPALRWQHANVVHLYHDDLAQILKEKSPKIWSPLRGSEPAAAMPNKLA